MRSPGFWETGRGGLRSDLLAPLGWAYGLATRARMAAIGPRRAAVPVLCVGNLVAGGAGKTPVALSIAARLGEGGMEVHFLSRGHGGARRGPLRVDPEFHDAREVGDEALLLARAAPTWVAADRPLGAAAAVAAGARVIVMDDGFQNPRLAKDLSLLVIDGGQGLGNRRCIPAGPLREPAAAGLARADGVALMGDDENGIARMVGELRPGLPLLRGRSKAGGEARELAGGTVVAFAGIGRPAKFFATLAELDCRVAAAHAFPDHHPYGDQEIEDLKTEAAAAGALLVTTAKDAQRLASPALDGITVLTITVEWDDEAALDEFLRPIKSA